MYSLLFDQEYVNRGKLLVALNQLDKQAHDRGTAVHEGEPSCEISAFGCGGVASKEVHVNDIRKAKS